MGTHHSGGGYSADVDSALFVGEKRIDVWSVGPTFFRFKAPHELEIGAECVLMTSVDGTEVIGPCYWLPVDDFPLPSTSSPE